MSLKNSNDTIGNRTRDLPVCSNIITELNDHQISLIRYFFLLLFTHLFLGLMFILFYSC